MGNELQTYNLETVIVLRNDYNAATKFGQDTSDVILLPGELGVHYPQDADQNITSQPIIKIGDGRSTWADLVEVGYRQPIDKATLMITGDNKLTLAGVNNDTAQGKFLATLVDGTLTWTDYDTSIGAIEDKLTETTDNLAELVQDLGDFKAEISGKYITLEYVQSNYYTAAIIDQKLMNLDIKAATTDKIGGIKSSNGSNEVTVDEDGVGTVNYVNVNTLVQDTGTYILFDGGSASSYPN